MAVYKLMHKDDIAALLEMDDQCRIITRQKVIVQELMPLQAQNDIRGLSRWWDQRQVPMNQEGITELLGSLNLSHSADFLMKNLGLSLNDCYWIQPLSENLLWSDINLFANSFQTFSISDTQQQSDTVYTPVSSTGGELIKRWLIIDGRRVLLKGNKAGGSAQQSRNEVFTSRLHDRQQCDNFVQYSTAPLSLIRKDMQGLGCISENFASEEMEFVPAIQIVESEKKRNDVSWFEHFIAVCTKHGIEEEVIRDFMDYLLLTDYIITNTDRHFMNFGVMRDSNTLKFMKPAPIFDSGNSMFYRNRKLPDLDSVAINSFAQTEKKQLKHVRNRSAVDFDRLPDEADFEEIYRPDEESDVYLPMIIEGYRKKIDMLIAWQR